MNMSDRIVVMQAGVIEQTGTAEEIYGSPANEFVAQFLGESNLLTGSYEENGTGAAFHYGSVALEVPKQMKRPKVISIRPEQICFVQGGGVLTGIITECVFMGQIANQHRTASYRPDTACLFKGSKRSWNNNRYNMGYEESKLYIKRRDCMKKLEIKFSRPDKLKVKTDIK